MSNFLFYFSNIGFEIFFKLKAYTLLLIILIKIIITYNYLYYVINNAKNIIYGTEKLL